MALIEYICFANVVRIPIYACVTNAYVSAQGLDGTVRAVSSGLTGDRLNARQFELDDVAMYFQAGQDLTPHLPGQAAFFAELAAALRDRKALPFETLADVAYRSRQLVDSYCATMRDAAICALAGPQAFAPPVQTQPRPDVTHIIAMADAYVGPIRSIYNGTRAAVLPITEFGEAPPGTGFSLEAFRKVVRCAQAQVPRIIERALS